MLSDDELEAIRKMIVSAVTEGVKAVFGEKKASANAERQRRLRERRRNAKRNAKVTPRQSEKRNAKSNGESNASVTLEAPTTATWKAYSGAYEKRWGAPPVRNKAVNGMLAQYVARIPAEEAPAVAAFYLQSNRGLYVSAKHPVQLLLRNAESLRTEWATGRAGTESEARQADRTAATGNVFGKLIEESRNAGK